jgi:large subunit ribosomal protein L2
MGLKIFSARSHASRGGVVFFFSDIKNTTPEKSLTVPLKKRSARNNHGQITIRHQGGAHKRRYRLIDFKRNKMEVPGKVFSIEYDPNRTSRIALINYADGEKCYIIAPIGLNVGDSVICSMKADIKPGNCLPLGSIPVGTIIHNIEMRPGKGAQICRGAGASATLAGKGEQYCQVRLPSGELKQILTACKASVGQVGNTDNENIKLGKAGKSRWRGIRPSVRGMHMNPVDHPLGGGEGVGKGHHPVTPWGKPCKGFKTRHNKRTNSSIIKRRK